MTTFDWVMVPLDDAPRSDGALQTGIDLARTAHAGLWLVSVVKDRRDEPEMRSYLDDSASGAGVGTRCTVLYGSPPGDAIADAALIASAFPDGGTVVCMATHGRGRVSEALLGSSASSVVAKVSRPTLLVGPGFARPVRSAFHRLVVAVESGSPHGGLRDLAKSWEQVMGLECESVELRHGRDIDVVFDEHPAWLGDSYVATPVTPSLAPSFSGLDRFASDVLRASRVPVLLVPAR